MKLGTETRSLVNHIYSRAVIGQSEPEIGMGVTLLGWTDRLPGTIIEISRSTSRVIIWVRGDKAVRVDQNGMSESQDWRIEPNPRGHVWMFRRRVNGQWEEVEVSSKTGRVRKNGGYGLRVGERERYYDFSF